MVDLTCKDIIFNFGDKEKASFKTLKAAFTTVPMLQYPDQDCEFHLETDMSEFTIGGVVTTTPTPVCSITNSGCIADQ